MAIRHTPPQTLALCAILAAILFAAGIALAAAPAGVSLAATPAVAPAAPAPAAPLFKDADEKAAQAAWQPMGGSAPVSVAEVGGVRAVRFPCKFRDTKEERASWDRAVKLDLTACRAIRFRMFCREPSPVSSFVIYFQSGDGWYTASFAAEGGEKWADVTVEKDETRIEGRPAGWGNISTIRISAWRGAAKDTEFYLADFTLLGQAAAVAVVRGESAARSAPGEVESVVQFTGTVVRALRDLGVEYTVINDQDLTPERLKAVKLVLLPHNPVMPDAAADALARFVEAGGKVIGFYGLPDKLWPVLGLEGGQHVPQKSPGQFASIRFEKDALAGAPEAVAQQSWNIRTAKPLEGRGRIIARWFDKDGRDTGYPAVIASDAGMFMTHVLMSGEAPASRRMILAMVGRYLPGVWGQAAQASLKRVEEFELYVLDHHYEVSSPEQYLNHLAKDFAALQLDWAEAHALVQEGTDAEKNGKPVEAQRLFIEALAGADKVHHQLLNLLCTYQVSPPGEFHAMWCHSAFGPQGMDWDAAIKTLAENGFTAIFPNMLWGGTAYYESTVLPVAPEVKEKGDQIALCLAACKKYGVQCHVWKVNWNMGGRAPREFAERMKAAGRTQVRFDGKPEAAWLCPSHPDNQKLETDAMVEVATKYDVDGVHFDYIRYPDRDGCFCPGCRERFEKAAGVKVATWPADVRKDPALAPKWLDWRRSNITAVVAAVSEVVHKARPKCKVSAAVFSNWPVDRDNVGQDWKLWCERGYMDFVCPMDYTPHTAQFGNMVAQQIAWAGKVPVYPGIGLSTWTPPTDVVKVIEQIRAAREKGAKGFTIFEFNAASAREVVPMLGKGITRKEAAAK
jgi:uncharacterized lipoprotein YddW (UPF0748 family)